MFDILDEFLNNLHQESLKDCSILLLLDHNSNMQDLVDLSINSIKRIKKKLFIPLECAPEVAKLRK